MYHAHDGCGWHGVGSGGVTHVHGCMGAWVHGVMPYNVHETWVTGGSVGGWGWAWQVGGCHGGRGRGVRVSMLTHATHVAKQASKVHGSHGCLVHLVRIGCMVLGSVHKKNHSVKSGLSVCVLGLPTYLFGPFHYFNNCFIRYLFLIKTITI